MNRTKAILGFRSVTEAILHLRAEGKSTREIAEIVGRSTKLVHKTELTARYRKKPRQLLLPVRIYTRLQNAADLRGVSATELALQIITTVARDDIIDAVLDDGGLGA